ncbi:MAG TPA: MMPL family transporter [Acidimicrobiales bacterium]
MASLLGRLAWFTVRRRRWVLAASALFVLASTGIGAGAFGVLRGGGFDDPDAESSRAADVLDDVFDTDDPDVVLLVRTTTGTVDDPAASRAGTELAQRLARIPEVTEVASYWTSGRPAPLRSDGGDEAMVLGRLTTQDDEANETVSEIRDELGGEQGAVEVAVGGPAAVTEELRGSVETSLARAEMIAIPLTLLLLVFVFRSLAGAALPLIVGAMAITGTLLALFVLGSLTDVSIFSINLTTALGLGLAIDYSLFIVSRFREELHGGLAPADAVVRSIETAGRTVAISALTVAVALSALIVFPMYFLRSFAYAGIAVVLLAMVASLTTLPAMLAVVGRRIDSRRARRRGAAGVGAFPGGETRGVWHRIATTVMRRPVPIALGVTALLVLLGTPFLRLSTGLPDERALPESAESRRVSERIADGFDGDSGQAFPIVAESVDPAGDELVAFAAQVSDLDGVARVEAPGGTWAHGRRVAGPTPASGRFAADDAAWVSVVPTVGAQTPEGARLAEELRGLDAPFPFLVGGGAAQLIDTNDALTAGLPLALAIVAVTTLVLLFLMTGSVLIPVKAVLLNLLSLTATFGATVWVFQDGNLSGLLDFTATGRIDASVPILMFCIAFGLSMDYEVFLLSRIKEEHDRSGDNTASVALGLERTGRIVSAAAALLAITFIAFGTADVSFLKLFGLGLALAVLMDATVIRGLLVPAFMRLAGRANWWAPAPLRRLHSRFGIREAPAPAALPSPADDPEPVPDAAA